MSSIPDVAIVGGGAVGACVAAELAARGASVELLERGASVAAGASFGNAGIVGPAHVAPLGGPEAVRDALRWLGRPGTPFGLRARPSLAPWLARFLRASTPAQVRHGMEVLGPLGAASARMHAELAAGGLDTGYAQRGMLDVYDDEAALEAAAHGDAQVLRAADLPAWLARPAAGALFHPGEAHCDPGRFVEAVAADAQRRGAVVRTGTEVLEVRRRGRQVTLWTTRGEVRAKLVVIAAGVWTPRLVRGLGLTLPIMGAKGYHVDLDASPSDPDMPVFFQARRAVLTPMPGRLRAAGTLELTTDETSVDRRRVDGILAAAADVRGFDPARARTVWRGMRPCTPDGLPVIGHAPAVDDVVVAAGHGMWGLQLAPVTGVLVAQLAAGERPEHDLAPLDPGRF
jgi:D-amino-acid dehydrogenase